MRKEEILRFWQCTSQAAFVINLANEDRRPLAKLRMVALEYAAATVR
jgi:hypothetical protein